MTKWKKNPKPKDDQNPAINPPEAEDRQVKVIIMSGYPHQEPLDELLAQRVIDWVQKPPKLEHLAQVLRRVLWSSDA